MLTIAIFFIFWFLSSLQDFHLREVLDVHQPGHPAGAVAHRQVVDALPFENLQELRRVRGGKIGMIFQEPMSALSPLHRIGDQLVETALLHLDIGKREARALALDWLRRVGLPDAEQRMDDLPHQLSGGMRQRVMLAMAMLPEPEILLADEPTTALDVTVQAQIFELLARMTGEGTAMVLVTHDMALAYQAADRVCVMNAGKIVEAGPVEEVFRHPRHPYTRRLLASVPRLDG